jgi:lipopolysaccharide/colanic/teichoic acid biosynthesis glycosyltransferase
MVELDLEYVRNWSLSLDISILLETPRAVLVGKGAY